jgi:hypothetical protein
MKAKALIFACLMGATITGAAIGTAKAEGMSGNMMRGGRTDRMGADHGAMQHGKGMMCPMMQSGMMHGGMMGSGVMGGGTTLFGSRVTPMMNLSVDDVRGYLTSKIEHLNNKRLKVGNVDSADSIITADIVTVDNSLVQRLKVDRHTGAITYEN